MGINDPICKIMSLLNVPNIFIRPNKKEKQHEADVCKYSFIDPSGDHLTLLNVFNQYQNNNYDDNWAKDHYLNYKSLRMAKEVYDQLIYVSKNIFNKESIITNEDIIKDKYKISEYIIICLLRGSFNKVCHYDRQGIYRTLGEHIQVKIHPSCVLDTKAEYVLFDNYVITKKNYVRGVSRIESEWLFIANHKY